MVDQPWVPELLHICRLYRYGGLIGLLHHDHMGQRIPYKECAEILGDCRG